jgi:NOL1/NOP2/fmu family ribosome biogenesis protein
VRGFTVWSSSTSDGGQDRVCLTGQAVIIFTSKEDINMVEVTAAATEQIQAYFKGKEVSPIRIFLNEGG